MASSVATDKFALHKNFSNYEGWGAYKGQGAKGTIVPTDAADLNEKKSFSSRFLQVVKSTCNAVKTFFQEICRKIVSFYSQKKQTETLPNKPSVRPHLSRGEERSGFADSARNFSRNSIKDITPVNDSVIHPTRERSVQDLEAQPIDKSTNNVGPQVGSQEGPTQLSNHDYLQAGSNVVQWSLIGASMYGLAPTIIVPASFIAGLGSEIASFCLLPKDAHWFRKMLSIPVLSSALIRYNPWIGNLFGAVSFYNSSSYSMKKIWQTWNEYTKNPYEATKTGAVHLFNLISGTTFAADKAGLIRLPKPKAPPEPPHEVPEHIDEAGNFDPKKVSEDIPRRRVRVATVYNNHGNKERDRVSDVVVQSQDKYAELHGYEREVISDAHMTDGRCWLDEAETVRTNCTPYFEKLEYAVAKCHDPSAQGKTIVIMDDDMPITNPNIRIDRMFEHLRRNPDGTIVPAKLILAQEAGDWPGLCNEGICFKLPGTEIGQHHPKTAVNTGFIMFEANREEPQCKFLEKALEHRNTPMDKMSSVSSLIARKFPICKRVGVCDHGDTSLGDHTAVALEIQAGYDREGEGFFDRVVRVVPQRDESHKFRSHIAFNTLHRTGCNWPKGAPAPYDIGDHDTLPQNIHGVWKPGDFAGQPAGFKVMGRYPLEKVNGVCIADKTKPIENMRLKKVQEMLNKKELPIRWKFMMTHNEKNSKASTVDIVTPNHKLLAYMHRGEFVEDTSPMSLVSSHPFKGKDGIVYEPCLNRDTGKYEPCNGPTNFEPFQMETAPYWRKVAFTDRWVNQPIDPKFRDVMVYGDTDLFYDPNLDLYQMLRVESGNAHPALLVAGDIPQISSTNTGFYMIEKSLAARKIVDVWKQGRDNPSFHPKNVDCPTFGWGGATQSCGLHEQSVLNEMLKNDPKIKVISVRDNSRPYGAVNALARQGHWHGAVRGWNDNEVRYNGDPSWIKPQRGDAVIQASGVPKMGRNYREPEYMNRPIRRAVLKKAMKDYMPPLRYLPVYSASSKKTQ